MKKNKIFFSILIILLSIKLYCLEDFNYRINVGDKLYISVWDEPSLSQEVNVDYEGYIDFPFIKRIKVSDLTVKELKELLEDLLASYIKNPMVQIKIIKYNNYNVYLYGYLENEQKFENKLKLINLEYPMKLSDLIASYIPNISSDSLKSIYVLDKYKNGKIYNLFQFFKTNDLSYNKLLCAGDIIFVPKPKTVSIMGFVNNAGNYTIETEKPITLSELVLKAGGFKQFEGDKNLNCRAIIIKSDGSINNLVFNDIFQDNKNDTYLSSGDKVFILEHKQVIYVFGEVNNIGSIPFEENMTMVKTLSLVKGYTGKAKLNSSFIIRNYFGKDKKIIPVKIGDIIKGKSDDTIKLKIDDIVYIPSDPIDNLSDYTKKILPFFQTFISGNDVRKIITGEDENTND